MNILYITNNDLRGQQFNGHLLKQLLSPLGHKVSMGVAQKESSENSIRKLEVNGGLKRYVRQFDSVLRVLERELSLQSLSSIGSLSLYSMPEYKNADIVHLQLIHLGQFFSLFNIPRMSREHKLVWTMHDPWLMTGHCIYPLDCERWKIGCGKCPYRDLPFPIKRDTSAFMWKIKNWIMKRSDVHLIVASEWMRNMVKQSPILSHLPCSLIPFGLDLEIFRPRDKIASRMCFSIPPDANVLAFRSQDEAGYKGSDYIEAALSQIEPNKETYLITFDRIGGLKSLRNKYHFIELGWVSNHHVTATALSAADIFLSPSIAEAFGVMPVESMACGTPVIVFDGTSLPDVIHAPEGGVVVPYRDSKALSQAIQELLEDRDLRQSYSENGIKIVQNEYPLERYVQRHLELYEGLCA